MTDDTAPKAGTGQWWREPGFIAFDTETTGIDPATDRIVTAAAIRFIGGVPVEVRSWLLRLDVPIPEASTEIHGISDEISQRDGIDPADGLAELRRFLLAGSLPIVAFNAEFDTAMLAANLQRVGVPMLPDVQVICPMVLDKQFNRYVSGRNQRRLQPTARRYGITVSDEDWHGAAPDAVVAGQILLAQLAANDDLAAMRLDELVRMIPVWRAEHEASFRAWLASGPTERNRAVRP